MDLVYNYMPDVYSYQAVRHTTTSYDYWLNNETAKKDCYRGNKKKPQQPKKDSACSGKSARDNCPICQERQRRPLATYIRSKSREERKLDASIEEAEEEEDECEEQGAQSNVAGVAQSNGSNAARAPNAAATAAKQQPQQQPCPE